MTKTIYKVSVGASSLISCRLQIRANLMYMKWIIFIFPAYMIYQKFVRRPKS
jgi:hypothetical protein